MWTTGTFRLIGMDPIAEKNTLDVGIESATGSVPENEATLATGTRTGADALLPRVPGMMAHNPDTTLEAH